MEGRAETKKLNSPQFLRLRVAFHTLSPFYLRV